MRLTKTARRVESSAYDWEPPSEFDGYRLKSCIGRGAMGRVYLAQDTILDRPIAIKFIDAFKPDSEQQERFLLEARAVARLQHPNVVAIYRVGDVQGHPYIASEFVRGDRLDYLPLPVSGERALRIGLGLARGLAAAHRRGVLHRDIKPANVILWEGTEVKLLDFGLAKLIAQERTSASDLFVEASRVETEPVDPVRTQPIPVPVSTPSKIELTGEGAVIGTPGYIAPEIWEGEGATFRSDVYSVGAVLYQLCTGKPPYTGKTLEELRTAALSREATPITSASAIDPGFVAVINRCMNRDPSLRLGSAEELRDALEALLPERRASALPEGNPYRGLQAFEAEHRALFFGRDSEIRAILERLRNEPFVVVAGASGVGKSSLCRAGILPRAAEHGLWDKRPWSTVTLTPGRRPVFALAAALAGFLEKDEDVLAADIRKDWREVHRELRKRQRSRGPLLIFIDQMEELVTLSDPAETANIAEVIESFSTAAPGLRLIATVRGDFLVRVASLPGLSDEVSRALYVLKPLAAENVREAVVGPARAKGVNFESESMVENLVAATVESEGALPLLQFALAELWEARDVARAVIPGSALEARGGVTGALARHADGVLAALTAEQRAAARRILPLLVTLDGTRARQTEKELGAEEAQQKSALAGLVRGRLLTASESTEGEGSAYEVTHEALITSWPTLRHWLEEDAERRILHDRLATAISEWERSGKKREGLWSSRQIAETALLQPSELLPRERTFLEASRRVIRLRLAGWIAVALILVGSAFGGYGALRIKARREMAGRVAALTEQGLALLSQARDRNGEVETLRKKAFDLFDHGNREEAERVWTQAQAAAIASADLYANAGRALEAALLLRTDASSTRNVLADLLYDRVLIAQRDHQTSAQNELAARLPLYDDGSRVAKLKAPATLTVETSVPGAELRIQRFEGRPLENPVLTEVSSILKTPVNGLQQAAGSYLLTLSADSRVTTRVPIVLRRGESHSLKIRLLLESQVPTGFAYVPDGAFLFGSLAEDELRTNFFQTVPLHPVHTGPYLIARHETTFGDWLVYLADQPAKERSKRAPSIGSGNWGGALALKQTSSGWTLTIELGPQIHRLALGDPLSLPDRNDRREQDWTRLPVVGITAEVAEHYLSWLRATGKVPRARFCTEQEWERAARGADGRDYPQGSYLRPQDANFDETYERKASAMGPDEVGAHPGSTSAFGLDDTSGNVWELTRSSQRDAEFAAKGGGWSQHRVAGQLSNREPITRTFKDVGLGLRVCATIPD